jgi:hypothetical protein
LRLSINCSRVRRTPGRSRRARAARHDQQQLRSVTVENELLGAIQHEARAGARGPQRAAERGMTMGFLERERQRQRAIRDAWQQLLLLRLRSGQPDRGRTEHAARVQRRGGQRASALLEQQRQARESEACAAVLDRDRRTGPAELRHAPPQRGRPAQRVMRVAQRAQCGNRGLGAQELARGVAQQLLLRIRCQAHACLSRHRAAPAPCAR